MATDPVKCQGFVSAELTGKLEEKQDSNQFNKAASTGQYAKLNRNTVLRSIIVLSIIHTHQHV